MSSYTVKPGDTLQLISGHEYGELTRAQDIAAANPGVREPLTPGTVLIIPPPLPEPVPSRPAPKPYERVTLRVDGVEFANWESVQVTRGVDSVSKFMLVAPTPDDATFRKAFRPLAFPPCELLLGSATLLTGQVVDPRPVSGEPRRTTVEGYGAPGVLGDAMMPDNFDARLFRKEKLDSIAGALCKPFGIKVDAQVDVGEPFRRARIEPGSKVLDFLSELAADRGVLLRDDVDGALVITDGGTAGSPVVDIERGKSPYMHGLIEVKPQEWYSHVTGFRSGSSGKRHTEVNGLIQGVLRPFAWRVTRSEGRELPVAVKTRAGRMLTRVLTAKITLATWFDPQGELWEPGTTLRLTDADLQILNPYEFTIREVVYVRTNDGTETAELSLVLPGAFAGVLPSSLPWD